MAYIHLYKQETLTGQSEGLTATSIVLDENASTENGYYNGWTIKLFSGNLVGQEREIVSYDGATKTATVTSWTGFDQEYIAQYRITGILNNGDESGDKVSEETGDNPITIFNLNASLDEVSTGYPIALRCDENFQTSGDAVLEFEGETSEKWSLSKDNSTWTEWGEGLVYTEIIGDKNKLLYVRARATNDEAPQNDESVSIKLITEINPA